MIEKRKPSIVLMSETRLIDDIMDSEVNLKGYKIIRGDSNSRVLGVSRCM